MVFNYKIILILCVILSHSFCFSQNKMNGPLFSNLNLSSDNEYGKVENSILTFYQKWISPIKGGNTCQMFPSCSQYAKVAFENYPVLFAFILTCERLLRCGRELDLYSVIVNNNELKFFDPVPDNFNE